MTIKEMHYDFKRKFNKVDSQKNRNILVPEIDLYLNEAEEIFVKLIAEPRKKGSLGFETSQRSTEDIRSIVVTSLIVPNSITGTGVLPTTYRYYVAGKATISKGKCLNKKAKLVIIQHDDEAEGSVFDKSSFEWREVNAVFNSDGLKVFTDGTFTVNNVSVTYIRKTNYMHNAEDFRVGGYELSPGVALIGSVNCELPDHTHREIVDIAVMLASSEIQTSDYQVKLNKLNFNQII
jgi:hypothetical protein